MNAGDWAATGSESFSASGSVFDTAASGNNTEISLLLKRNAFRLSTPSRKLEKSRYRPKRRSSPRVATVVLLFPFMPNLPNP